MNENPIGMHNGIIGTFLRRPLGTLAVCLCLVILGAFAFAYVSVELYPHAKFPVLSISTSLSDSSPEEIETLITKPIEEAVADVSGLRKIQSVSNEGESEITLQFHYGHDISDKALEVRSRIRRLFPLLPKDARFPVITRYDPSGAPAVVFSVTGKGSKEDLAGWVNNTLKPRLSRIDGVAMVRISGAPKEEIIVDCDVGRLNALQINIEDVHRAIKTGHNSLPSGFMISQGRLLPVVTAGKVSTAAEVAQLPVKMAKLADVANVGQLAHVRLGAEEPREIVRYNGESLITVAVFRSSGSDLRRLWTEVKNQVDDARSMLIPTPTVQVITNQAEDLELVLHRFRVMMGITSLITGSILFIFLGSLRSTVVVLSSIPLSLCVSLLLMQAFGVTLDLLSLGGLTLGLGILVDNAIVVVESISRRWSEGWGTTEGVVTGSEEVALPLTLSTICTVIVFVPMVFVSREVRLLFVGFAWTVAASLLASLLASLVLVPVLYRYSAWRISSTKTRPILNFDLIYNGYSRLLTFAADYRFLVIGAAALFLLSGAILARGLSFRETLSTEVRHFRLFMIMPPGTATDLTSAEAGMVEKRLLSLRGVGGVHTEVQRNQARFTIAVKQDSSADRKTTLNTGQIKDLLKDKPQLQFHIVPLGQQDKEAKITLNIQGPSGERLTSVRDTIRHSLQTLPGVKDIMVHQADQVPILEFPVSHEEVGFRGWHATGLAHILRSHLTGPIAAKITGSNRIIQVRVRGSRLAGEDLKPLPHLLAPNERGDLVPLSELTQPAIRLGLAQLQRENRRPVLRMTLLLDEHDPLTVAQEVRNTLNPILSGSGCDYSFGDEIQDILRTRREMLKAACMGLALMYLVLIVATESVLQPILVLTAVPFGAAGAVMALRLLDVSVTLPVYVGMIILCGLVMNVNIVMVYTINSRMRSGEKLDDSVKNGAFRRLRPIVMTVLTALGGSTPMLFDHGSGSQLWFPFAVTLAAGMTSAGLFSLVLTPTLFTAVESIRRRRIKWRKTLAGHKPS